MSVVLEMKKVSKSFGNASVLKNINLKIKKGENVDEEYMIPFELVTSDNQNDFK